MTISTTDFPTWFFAGFYGGLVCCVLAIVFSVRALYTGLRRRVTTRRPLVVVVVCSASFLCLWLTFFWFNVYFNGLVAFAETTAVLCCVVLFGWLVPIGATAFTSILSSSDVSNSGRPEEIGRASCRERVCQYV